MWFRWISDGFLNENLMQPSYEVSEVDAVLVCREVVHSSGFAGAPGTKKCPYYVSVSQALVGDGGWAGDWIYGK